ncbi:MAG: polysaccharide export protein [Siculibacillus sp.]|nr:polysaccharide export protein [Siculibacillus sp.]
MTAKTGEFLGVGGRHTTALSRIAIAAALSAGLVGCASNPGSGPSDAAIVENADTKIDSIEGYRLIELTAATVAPYRVRTTEDRPGGSGAETQARVRLAPGDAMRIVIAEGREGGLFAPLTAGGTNFPNVRVDSTGSISLPYVGRVAVKGLDTPEVEARVREKLKGVSVEPQVYVELVANRNNSVLVSGEVKAPIRVSMLDGPMTVIDAVAKAGGLTKSPLQSDAVIRHGTSVRRIPMERVQSGSNPTLSPGDTLTIEARFRGFNAIGAVKQPGQLEFNKANPTVMDGLAQAQWLNDDAANPTGVFLFRMDEPHGYRDDTGKWHPANMIFRIDMRKPESLFIAQTVALKPGDTLYVTTAPSYEWIKLIKPIAITMTTLRTAVSLSSGVTDLAP